jgi:hypothetical protein
MRVVLSAFLLMFVASCSNRGAATPLCDVANTPDRFAGKVVTVVDVVTVDGHGDPFFVPDPQCASSSLLPVAFDQLQPATKDSFTKIIRSLAMTSVHGHSAGLRGTYTLRLSRQPVGWQVSLLNAESMQVVKADAKEESLARRVPPEPTH